MRWLVLGVSCLAIAACSKGSESRDSGAAYESAPTSVSDTAITDGPASRAAPGIVPTAAPGVAFNYRYAFTLDPARVAAIQEQHASACEQLGIARCRITGMRYRLVGEHDVRAMLAFKLDPAIARAFGKNGIAAVEKADGTLVDAEISGVDAGAALSRLAVDRARAEAEIQRLDAALAKAKSAAERQALQEQRAAQTARLASANDSSSDARESLATTPMTFEYDSGAAIRGFDATAPFESAADTFLGSAQVTLAVVLGALALAVPPGIVLLLGWLVWRRFRRRPAPRPASD